MSQPLRVGAPPYLVARPLLHGLGDEPGIALVSDVPSRLVQGLRDGTLDVALASSVEIFRRPGYTILPGLCIGANGEAGSVRLFTRRSLSAIRTVALDAASRSAGAVVRILVGSFAPHRVDYPELALDADGAASGTDAFLRVGDAALRAPTPPGYEAIDLGEAWKELTGFPIVFALWIVRPGVDVGGLEKAFQSAARRGLARRDAFADEAAAAMGLPADALRRYLSELCRYDLREEGMKEGLLALRDRGATAGVCRADLRPANYRAPAGARAEGA